MVSTDAHEGRYEPTPCARCHSPEGFDTLQFNHDDTASVPITYLPSILVTKTADVATVDAANDVINYTITVANTGNVALAPTSVSDVVESYPATAPVYVSGDTDNDGLLDVGETWTYSDSYTVTVQVAADGDVIVRYGVTGSTRA